MTVNHKLSLAPQVQVDPGQLSDVERLERNIQLLPRSVGESLEALCKYKVLLGALSPMLS